MPEDKDSKIDKETILKAIRSLKDRGWDINPYTVADELNLSRSAIYRNAEAMQLIVQDRQGTFGMDIAASLDLARKIQELERSNAELLNKLHGLQTGPEINPPDLSFSAQSEVVKSETIAEPLPTEPERFSLPKTGLSQAEESNLLLSLSWRDIEAIYNLPVLSLKDYAAAKPAVKEPVPSPTFPDVAIGGPHYQFDPLPAPTEAPSQSSPAQPVSAKKTIENVPIYPDSTTGATHYQVDSPIVVPEGLSDATLGSEKAPPGTVEDVGSAPFYPNAAIDTPPFRFDPTSEELAKSAPKLDSPADSSLNDVYMPGDIPDLDSLDIFDGLESIDDLQHIHVIDDVNLDTTTTDATTKDWQTDSSSSTAGTIGSVGGTDTTEELRNLINSRIKQASDQFTDQSQPTKSSEDIKSAQNLARSKFVGSGKPQEPVESQTFVAKSVPPDIRKACLLLGIRPEELTTELVLEFWKKQIAAPGVHPDLGGDTESAIYLNTAKDSLLHWLEAQAPKLGKRFKQPTKEPSQPKRSNKTDKDK